MRQGEFMRKEGKKEILDGCAVSRKCDGVCRQLHRKDYDQYGHPKGEDTECPAFYRYYIEKRKIETNRFGKKKEKIVKVELR